MNKTRVYISSNTKKIHSKRSFLFRVIFFGAVVIVMGVLASGCEDVPSPNNIASLLHINWNHQMNYCMVHL